MARKCPHCESTIEGRANKIYCDLRCSRGARYRRFRARHNKVRTIACPNCGTVHTRLNNRIYCTMECRIAHGTIRIPRAKWLEYKRRYRMNRKRKAQGLSPIYSPNRRTVKPVIVKVELETETRETPKIRRATSMAEAQQHAGREVYG